VAARIIDGKAIAAKFREQVAEEVQQLRQQTGVVPHLAAVLVGDDPASAVYVRNKQKACDKAGIRSTLHRLPASTTEQELLRLIDQLNRDD